MKKMLIILVALLLMSQGLFAEEPQIAYRILDSYVQNKNLEAQDKTGWWVVTGIGGALTLGGATTYFAKDQVTQNPEELKIANIVSYSLMGSGVTLSAIGLIGLLSKPIDYTKKYQDVYSEEDSKIREALAAASLRNLAHQKRDERIGSAITYFLIPVLGGIITTTVNLTRGREWSYGLTDTLSASSYNIILGIIELITLSKEERLFDQYKAAQSAYYGS